MGPPQKIFGTWVLSEARAPVLVSTKTWEARAKATWPAVWASPSAFLLPCGWILQSICLTGHLQLAKPWGGYGGELHGTPSDINFRARFSSPITSISCPRTSLAQTSGSLPLHQCLKEKATELLENQKAEWEGQQNVVTLAGRGRGRLGGFPISVCSCFLRP